VIAVIGIPRLQGHGADADVAGLAASIAVAAAAADRRVELVGKIGDDPAGDVALLALARHQVGHVATLRDPARMTPVATAVDDPADLDVDPDADPRDTPGTAEDGTPEPASAPVLEAADVGLAMRYLPELAVIVTVHVAPEVVAEAVAAAGWAQTALIVVVDPAADPPVGLPTGALAIAVADHHELGAGAGAAIGRYAAAIDRGDPADAAYAELKATGMTPA
jgi:sugar/nucleoside kinase (ribokinase family)